MHILNEPGAYILEYTLSPEDICQCDLGEKIRYEIGAEKKMENVKEKEESGKISGKVSLKG
jgi:hypothetical protein